VKWAPPLPPLLWPLCSADGWVTLLLGSGTRSALPFSHLLLLYGGSPPPPWPHSHCLSVDGKSKDLMNASAIAPALLSASPPNLPPHHSVITGRRSVWGAVTRVRALQGAPNPVLLFSGVPLQGWLEFIGLSVGLSGVAYAGVHGILAPLIYMCTGGLGVWPTPRSVGRGVPLSGEGAASREGLPVHQRGCASERVGLKDNLQWEPNCTCLCRWTQRMAACGAVLP